MNRYSSFYLIGVIGVLSSCQFQQPRNDCDEVICETVHRYGVPLEPEDWSARGENGSVVSVRKDGVSVMRTYDAGTLHGDCTYSFPHRDTIQKREVYNQGSLCEEFSHYSSGLPFQQTVYISPTRQTKMSWFESGAPMAQEEFVNEKLVQGEYYNLNQQVESKVVDSNGLRLQYDGHGQLVSTDTIQNGQQVLSTTYHPCRTPAAIIPYRNGSIEGERRTYLPDGEPATVEMWQNNKQHGMTVVYDHGEKIAEVPYVNGYKHGVERRYRDGVNVAQETNWVQGVEHGPCYSYVGNATQTEWYFKGKKVANKATYDMLMNQ